MKLGAGDGLTRNISMTNGRTPKEVTISNGQPQLVEMEEDPVIISSYTSSVESGLNGQPHLLNST